MILSGCEDGGTLGSSLCDLGCQEGYTASEPVQGTCLGVPGSISAAYQHQAVICTPNSCEAPTPSNWVERELNGMRFFFNLVSGGQSMTRPFDGAQPSICSLAGPL